MHNFSFQHEDAGQTLIFQAILICPHRLGLGALVLLENKMLKAYFVTTLLFTIPLAAFYLYAPKLLMELAVVDQSVFALKVHEWLPGPSAQMTLGQMTEIAAMLLMSYLGLRARLRILVMIAMVLAIVRFSLFALAGEHEMLALMWLCLLYTSPSPRDKRQSRMPSSA